MEPRHNSNRIRFTKRTLDAIEQSDKRLVFHDEEQRGLCLHVEPSGRKTFYLYRKDTFGKPKRYGIGEFPSWSVDQAREKARAWSVDVDNGIDPMANRRAVKAEATLGEAWKSYLTDHAESRKKASSIEGDKRTWKAHLESLKTRKISSLTSDEVKRLHQKIGKDAPYSANRTMALLSKILSVAGVMPEKNPCRGVSKFKEQQRARFLDAEEIRRFVKIINTTPDPKDDQAVDQKMLDFFGMCLWTGARRGNVQSMSWADVSLKARTWTVAGEQTKNGEPITIHLSEPAIEILARRRDLNKLAKDAGEGSEYVFPGRYAEHLMQPKKSWARLCKKAGLKNLRIHDLRRTLGSWQAMTGASLPIIGKSLGHKTQQATAIYARLNLDPVRLSVNTATTAILAAASAEPEAAVLAKIG